MLRTLAPLNGTLEVITLASERERLSRQILLAEAQDVIDIHGIRRDFATSMAEAQYLVRHLENTETVDFLIVGAITTSIVVRYCRPFAKGVRNYQLARDLLEGLSAREKAYHQRFLDWRNKHIAHSVNSFETSYLYAEWESEPLIPATISSVGVAETRVIGLESVELDAVIELTGKYIGSLDKRISAEIERVLGLAKQAEPSAVIQKGNLKLSFPDLQAIDKSRSEK